ncbi:hypothetical protein [Streptomyces canus]|uniref:hypothetical protein n=1 Tax=Streptomyces canus TaxID=58343 RepID=UPI002E31678C|nr:hypothetical protein [Streptomyces canus]
MRSSTDRVAELFGTSEVRSLLATNLPGYEGYALSELVRAARDRLANTSAHSVGILARELRRAGLAIHHARDTGQHAGEDAAQLLTFTRTGCDWWASTVDHDGPGLVQARLIDPCEQLLYAGNTDERDDGYAALRGLATRLGSHSAFTPRWTLHIDDGA